MKASLFILYCLFTLASYAQNSNAEVLTNKSITDLKNAGIGATTLRSMITASACNFAVDSKAIIELKKSGIADEVIAAMIDKMSAAKPGNMSGSDTDKVAVEVRQQGAGIYAYVSSKLQELEPTVYSQAKQGSGILTGLTYGIAKTKSKLSLSGGHANVQLTTGRPLFYFYFNTEDKNPGQQTPTWLASASSPNEFMLVKFDAGRGGKSREVTSGSYNQYAGSSQGIDNSNKREFKFKKLDKGLYQIYFDTDLPAGEYCFMYAGSTGVNGVATPKVYDFGVK